MKKLFFIILLGITPLMAETFTDLEKLKDKFKDKIISGVVIDVPITQELADFLKDKTLENVTFGKTFKHATGIPLKNITFKGTITFNKPENMENITFEKETIDETATFKDNAANAFTISGGALVTAN